MASRAPKRVPESPGAPPAKRRSLDDTEMWQQGFSLSFSLGAQDLQKAAQRAAPLCLQEMPALTGKRARAAAHTGALARAFSVQLERDKFIGFGIVCNRFNRVTAVNDEAPAGRAGIRPFDRVLSVDGLAVVRDGLLAQMLSPKPAVCLVLERPPPAARASIAKREHLRIERLGMSPPDRAPLRPAASSPGATEGVEHKLALTWARGNAWGVQLTVGTHTVTSVKRDSPAALAGLIPGDVLEAIDGRPLSAASSAVADFQRKRNKAGKPKNTCMLTIRRRAPSPSAGVSPSAGGFNARMADCL